MTPPKTPFSYPRSAGKWRQTLRWLKLAWKQGVETSCVSDKVCWFEKAEAK